MTETLDDEEEGLKPHKNPSPETIPENKSLELKGVSIISRTGKVEQLREYSWRLPLEGTKAQTIVRLEVSEIETVDKEKVKEAKQRKEVKKSWLVVNG